MSKNKEETKKKCSKCRVEKDITREYYLASSDIISSDNRITICKECLSSIVDMDDPDTLIRAMRSIDRPFLKETYEGSLSKLNSFGEYMRMLATRQNRDKNYLNSEFSSDNSVYSNKKQQQEFEDGVEANKDGFTQEGLVALRKKWGKFTNEDYEFLEEFYKEYSYSYSTDAPAQVVLYKSIAKIHLQAEKELYEGNIKAYKDLMDLSSKLHNDGKIKAIQNTGADDDKGLSTYGLWIKEIEKEEPCEFFDDQDEYEDYDSFKIYWEKWFIRPFKNIFNVSNDFDVRDDKK